MSNKDIAEMIELSFAILIALGTLIWLYLNYKLGKIHDEVKKIRKEIKYSECVLESVECGECTHYTEAILVQEETEDVKTNESK